MRRHRLVFPMSFPDKQALMFFFGPLTGYVSLMFTVVVVAEILQFFVKIASVIRARARKATAPAEWHREDATGHAGIALAAAAPHTQQAAPR